MFQDIGNTPDLRSGVFLCVRGVFLCAGGRVKVLEPLTDTDHGSPQFTIRDGGGNLWTMGTCRGA